MYELQYFFPVVCLVYYTIFTVRTNIKLLIQDVEDLGHKMSISTALNNFHNVSLGQGQEVVAESAMEISAINGHWVVLQVFYLKKY